MRPRTLSAPRHLERALHLALDVAKGCRHLHEKHIIHRDLKSQNVWIHENGTAKVGDFGMSRVNNHNTMTMVGSPLWCAPEILRSERYDFTADVYSYSIILFEIFHWMEPYARMSVMQIMVAVTEHDERPEIDFEIPEEVCALICDSWHPDASQRPSFASLVERLECIIAMFRQELSTKQKRLSGREEAKQKRLSDTSKGKKNTQIPPLTPDSSGKQ
jgi:serine/threonine protein kinase